MYNGEKMLLSDGLYTMTLACRWYEITVYKQRQIV